MLRFADAKPEPAPNRPVTKIIQAVTEKPVAVTKKRGRPSTGDAKPNAARQAEFRKRRAGAKAGCASLTLDTVQ